MFVDLGLQPSQLLVNCKKLNIRGVSDKSFSKQKNLFKLNLIPT